MTDFTPGDWEVVSNPAGGPSTIIGARTGGDPTHRVVAFLPSHNPETAANADLIVAAPRLLAIAREMLDYFEHDEIMSRGGQCQLCLWWSGKRGSPDHECELVEIAEIVAKFSKESA